MVNLSTIFGKFKPFKALVIGDFMLDTYTIGKVERVSPEAPVTVLHVQREDERPGGAGNVALNLQALGGDVFCLGRIGNDAAGEKLKRLLPGSGLVYQKGMCTPLKNRIIAENQQIVRVDFENLEELDDLCGAEILRSFVEKIEDVDIVAISDYGKGLLTENLLQKIIHCSKDKGVPVIIDPKGIDYRKYRGADIIKPNLKEAYLAASADKNESLDAVAKRLFDITNAKNIIITRSQDGISLYEENKTPQNFPVVVREVIDVTGAGDTVLSILACAISNGLSLPDGIKIANIAAGIAIERFGCAHVTLNDIAQCLLEMNNLNKIFEEHHIFSLEQISKEKNITILAVCSQNGFTYELFKNIKFLSDENENRLIIYICDSNPDSDFISLLSSLKEVSLIVIEKDSIKDLCDKVGFLKIHLFDNNKLQLVQAIDALLK